MYVRISRQTKMVMLRTTTRFTDDTHFYEVRPLNHSGVVSEVHGEVSEHSLHEKIINSANTQM